MSPCTCFYAFSDIPKSFEILMEIFNILVYIYRRTRCTTRTCGARSGSPQLVRVGKTGETAANWNNSRPWIGLFQGAKCDNVPKCDLEFA